MKYKVGDKVRVVDHLAGPMHEGMLKEFGGKVVTISKAVDCGRSDVYSVDEDTRGYVWSENCFTPISEPHDKFNWDAFKRGDVTVTFKTNESQRQFLKRCETHGLKWASGENPTTRSYINLEALEIGDGGLYYRYAVDSTPTVYDWDARKYTKRAENPNTDWTAEEIEQAKELSHKLMCKIFDEGKYSVVWYVNVDNVDAVSISTDLGVPYTRNDGFWARPQGNDKFNPWIGKCVCLCKATQTPIPSFILNKNEVLYVG